MKFNNLISLSILWKLCKFDIMEHKIEMFKNKIILVGENKLLKFPC